jgi:hypothetical protein
VGVAALLGELHGWERSDSYALLQHICGGRFGQKRCDLGWIKMGDAVRGQLVQFRRGQSGYVVGNRAPDGRGKRKAVPGAKGKRQPFQTREAANEGKIIQAVGLQAAPGTDAPKLAQRRE